MTPEDRCELVLTITDEETIRNLVRVADMMNKPLMAALRQSLRDSLEMTKSLERGLGLTA